MICGRHCRAFWLILSCKIWESTKFSFNFAFLILLNFNFQISKNIDHDIFKTLKMQICDIFCFLNESLLSHYAWPSRNTRHGKPKWFLRSSLLSGPVWLFVLLELVTMSPCGAAVFQMTHWDPCNPIFPSLKLWGAYEPNFLIVFS